MKKLLEVKNFVAEMPSFKGTLHIINDISFSVHEEECFGIIGESGCGKTMTALSVLRYSERIGLKAVGGEILFDGEDVLKFSKRRLRGYNGRQVAVILQDPMAALDPLYTVENQMIETIRTHQKISRKESARQVQEIAGQLNISPEKLSCYPFQLSGGMLQRIVGAIAISCRPRLIIADEPTTALDVTIQLQYLKLLKSIQKKYKTAIIFISHDIKVISMMCDRIAVMYAGIIVETAEREELFHNTLHPYTRALFASANLEGAAVDKYVTIDGQPPDLVTQPKGCVFADRCPYSNLRCMESRPPRFTVKEGHEVYCWRVSDE